MKDVSHSGLRESKSSRGKSMKGKLKILMVFSEVAPFAKTGELGDVGSGLPKVLKEMGHDVRIITPQYRVTNERKYVLRDVIRLRNIDVLLGKKTLRINVKSAFLPNSKVQVYFIDYKPFFFREGIYTDPKSGKEYSDNDRRFILFSKGVLETLIKLQWQPDVIHCHDWQSGLTPFFLKIVNKDVPFFGNTFSLFTVHNFASQGNFDPDCVSDMGLDGDFIFPGSGIEFHGQCSFLKAGVVYADVVNTVSERYAQDVQSHQDYGYGMEEVLRSREDNFYGVVHGIDDSVWNPEVDSLIPKKYTIDDLSGKVENKRALLENQGLPFSTERPVVAMISRLTDQKGLDVVRDAFDEMMRMNIYFVLLGEGDESYHRFFDQVRKKYAGRVGINLNDDNTLTHLIEAGADIFLIPSRYEPCGLTQLRSLKYGTVPVVRETGGLADTVQPFDPETGKGTGFLFHDFSVKHLLRAVKRAVRTFEDRKTWLRIMKNGMREDFSWRGSAKRYVQLYGKCVSRKG